MGNYDESWDYEEEYRASQPDFKIYRDQMEIEQWFAEFQRRVNSILENMPRNDKIKHIEIKSELSRLCIEIKSNLSYPITLAITCA
jgi:hypothetical protein